MRVQIGSAEMDMGGPLLKEMRESNEILDRPDEMRKRLNEDGYLLLRGLQNRGKVLGARRAILERIQLAGGLDADAPMMDGRIRAGLGHDEGVPGMLELAATAGRGSEIKQVAESREILGFFEVLLGGEVQTFDYKWLRIVSTGRSTGVHYDIVYMGQGTKRLYSVWCPLGDVSIELGGLAVCTGSQRWSKVKDTYGNMDVYRDGVDGTLSTDPIELAEKYGGQWKTTSYQAGDVVVFGMFTAHASLSNRTDTYRLSMDTRYQLASEPTDERWMGENPFAEESEILNKTTISMESARRRWGI